MLSVPRVWMAESPEIVTFTSFAVATAALPTVASVTGPHSVPSS